MIRPVPSTSVVISGADTTAGSIRSRRRASGRTAATVADHRQIARIVIATTMPMSVPTPEQRRAAEGDHGHDRAEDQPDPHLLERDPADVAERDLVEGHRADDEGDGLAADVAAGADQERDEEAQRDGRLELVLEVRRTVPV